MERTVDFRDETVTAPAVMSNDSSQNLIITHVAQQENAKFGIICLHGLYQIKNTVILGITVEYQRTCKHTES